MTSSVTVRGKTVASDSGKCTNCGLCEIACSFVKFGTFNPERAYIQVDRKGPTEGYEVSFTEDCDACGYCWSVCKFDALILTREKRTVVGGR